MPLIRNISEQVARKTSRRGFFNRGANVLFGAFAGAAAGTVAGKGGSAIAGGGTFCAFPGPPCPCNECQSNGICAKPCIILTTYYASGCWVAPQNDATCCDCDCPDLPGSGHCGCGTDYHNNPAYCPEGTA